MEKRGKKKGRSRAGGRSLFISVFGRYGFFRRKVRITASGRKFRVLGVKQVPLGRMVTVEVEKGA